MLEAKIYCQRDRDPALTARGGGALWEFLGGDVPLGAWNP